jgi:biotin transporter BioY
MKFFIGFLLFAFLLGGWEYRHQRPARFIILFVVCVVLAVMFHSTKYV